MRRHELAGKATKPGPAKAHAVAPRELNKGHVAPFTGVQAVEVVFALARASVVVVVVVEEVVVEMVAVEGVVEVEQALPHGRRNAQRVVRRDLRGPPRACRRTR